MYVYMYVCVYVCVYVCAADAHIGDLLKAVYERLETLEGELKDFKK